MKYSAKVSASLDRRIAEFEQRQAIARQAPGGDKIVAMMHKPGSQNRKKGYSKQGPSYR